MPSKKITKLEIVLIIVTILLTISTITLSVLLYYLNKPKNSYLAYYEQKCNMFKLENSNLAQNQIVFIGDSITDGCALDNYYSSLPLATYNRGIGGDNTEGVLKRLKVSVFDINPSKIVLMIGINDINGNRTKEKVLENYEKILNTISTTLPNTKLFCLSILPINKTLETYSAINVQKSTTTILETNPEIEKLTQKYGATFVNLYPLFADSNNHLIENLSPDGIHLNNNGYKLYSSHLLPLLI